MVSPLLCAFWVVCLGTSLSCSKTLDGDKFRNNSDVFDASTGGQGTQADAGPISGVDSDAAPEPRCGDGVCGGGESVCTCADDCGESQRGQDDRRSHFAS